MKVSVVGFAEGSAVGRTMVQHWGPRKGPGKGTLWSGEGTWAGKSDGAGLGVQVGVFVGSGLGQMDGWALG